MGRYNSIRALNYALITSTVFVSLLIFVKQSQALTASYGRPYHGYLENGVLFPNQFPGYHLRDENRSYTTPEVAGALLDAIEAVRTQFPDTCDLFIGDFSTQGGGSAIHHRSHQNGRDVDIGMYAKGNHPLDTFVTMTEDNLDAPKTWCLIENIIRSQRVQYIFLDRRVQKILYDYAVTRGYDQAYLSRVFGNVRGSLIQHVRNHHDHMHVRFFTPWSTLAAHIGEGETEKKMVIDMAQQSYLPTKVNYYVNGTEQNLDTIAQSFGVTRRDVCRWNKLSPNAVPVPGSCLVFYKRSFESESVHLARSLQPGYIAEAPTVRMASLRTESAPSVADSVASPVENEAAEVKVADKKVAEERVIEEKSEPARAHAAPRKIAQPVVYKIQKGDTLAVVAKRTREDVAKICKLNGITKTTKLMPGQVIKIGTRMVVADSGQAATDAAPAKPSASSAICFTSDPKKPNSPTSAYYTVGKGDTLQKISRKSGISIDMLCQLNGLKRTSGLKPGQKIKLTQASLRMAPALGGAACNAKPSNKKQPAPPAVKGKPAPKGAQDAKATGKTGSKVVVKAVAGKSGSKKVVAAKKSGAAAKSAVKTKAGVKSTKKAVEAKANGKKSPAVADAKSKGTMGKFAKK